MAVEAIHQLSELRASWAAAPRPQSFLFFWGHTSKDPHIVGPECLSQWYPAPFHLDGIPYPTAEHAMMVAKARCFGDTEIVQQILADPCPKKAKQLGRQVRGFEAERWEAIDFEVVLRANLAKFSQNPVLGDFLRSTASKILVEASPLDAKWGIGLDRHSPLAQDPRTWKGSNLLGFALMQVRQSMGPRDPQA